MVKGRPVPVPPPSQMQRGCRQATAGIDICRLCPGSGDRHGRLKLRWAGCCARGGGVTATETLLAPAVFSGGEAATAAGAREERLQLQPEGFRQGPAGAALLPPASSLLQEVPQRGGKKAVQAPAATAPNAAAVPLAWRALQANGHRPAVGGGSRTGGKHPSPAACLPEGRLLGDGCVHTSHQVHRLACSKHPSGNLGKEGRDDRGATRGRRPEGKLLCPKVSRRHRNAGALLSNKKLLRGIVHKPMQEPSAQDPQVRLHGPNQQLQQHGFPARLRMTGTLLKHFVQPAEDSRCTLGSGTLARRQHPVQDGYEQRSGIQGAGQAGADLEEGQPRLQRPFLLFLL
mmetsp:Transcript_12116/g.34076  ORF Transcript_12116/g.34076 Transcript_12116/m.34076 type:complete len:344 (-) Transcript_12116:1280-2311(-)